MIHIQLPSGLSFVIRCFSSSPTTGWIGLGWVELSCFHCLNESPNTVASSSWQASHLVKLQLCCCCCYSYSLFAIAFLSTIRHDSVPKELAQLFSTFHVNRPPKQQHATHCVWPLPLPGVCSAQCNKYTHSHMLESMQHINFKLLDTCEDALHIYTRGTVDEGRVVRCCRKPRSSRSIAKLWMNAINVVTGCVSSKFWIENWNVDYLYPGFFTDYLFCNKWIRKYKLPSINRVTLFVRAVVSSEYVHIYLKIV